MHDRWQIASKLLSGAGGAVACWVVFTFGVGDRAGAWLWLLPVMLLAAEVLIILHAIGKGD